MSSPLCAVDESRELEARLEQALLRWRQEKETVYQEAARSSRLKTQSSELADRNTRLQLEVERLSSRLRLYDSLPMPEELKARMQDMQADVRSQEEAVAQLTLRKELVERELGVAQERIAVLERVVADKDGEVQVLKDENAAKVNEITAIGSKQRQLDSDYHLAKEVCSRLDKENTTLRDSEDALRAQLSELEAVLKDEDVASSSMRRIKFSLAASSTAVPPETSDDEHRLDEFGQGDGRRVGLDSPATLTRDTSNRSLDAATLDVARDSVLHSKDDLALLEADSEAGAELRR